MTNIMAPIELQNLSSNWKKLQEKLKSEKPKPSKPTSTEQTTHPNLKRKRATKETNALPEGARESNGGHVVSKPPKANTAIARKRQKMEEPSSIGASAKHHGHPSLNRSISMPSLRQSSLPADRSAATESLSILAPSPHHPDIENEGVSETALPGKYIALDCEMVGVGPEPNRDSALARVSLVNYHGHQVYDSYVQVSLPVTDYRTAVSGIEPRHLKPDVARTFKEVQDDVKILLQGRILVGHALKNDLGALILNHPRRDIRDTSQYAEFKKLARVPGRTPALKILVKELLGVDIQGGQHSSVEDARATMALFRLEKEGFEKEAMRRYGVARPVVEDEEVEVFDGTPVKRKRKSKKKKKKSSTTLA
jgi:RNA exonuclease 4